MKYQPQHRNGDNSAFFEEVKNFEDTIDLTHILSNEVLMPDTKLTHVKSFEYNVISTQISSTQISLSISSVKFDSCYPLSTRPLNLFAKCQNPT